MHADVGYDAANVLTARVVLADGEYSPERRLEILDADPGAREGHARRDERGVRQLPSRSPAARRCRRSR